MIEKLSLYHPLIIEGMGGYDPRDPYTVAEVITKQLQARWSAADLYSFSFGLAARPNASVNKKAPTFSSKNLKAPFDAPNLSEIL